MERNTNPNKTVRDFGYVRVSTADQNIDRQREEMERHKLDKIFIDTQSGKNLDRPELQIMLDQLRRGDSVTVLSIDRLCRNAKDLLELVQRFEDKGVTLKILNLGVDTSTDMGKFMLTIVGAIAELERKQIRERQRQGIEIAKRNGKYKGRMRKEVKEFEDVYRQWEENKITSEQAAKLLEVSRATFYRRVAEHQIEIADNEVIDF